VVGVVAVVGTFFMNILVWLIGTPCSFKPLIISLSWSVSRALFLAARECGVVGVVLLWGRLGVVTVSLLSAIIGLEDLGSL